MQRIINVKLADVFPLEDEYGNQYMSRDYSTKANQDYVHELAESMRMKGIPDEPIAVVADGGIYRVKTGNSRVMAMRELGTAECPAVIDDEDTVQSVIEAVVRTDVKKKYEDVERSRFVQQLAMFGDDQYVSDVAGIEVSKVKRIRRAAKAVDDAAEDMTLDRLLLIEEFADDPEAVKELSECKEGEARWKADSIRRKRRNAERRAAFEAALGLQGVPVAGSRADVDGMSYFVRVPEPAEVAAYLPPEWEDGQVAALFQECYDGVRCEVYVAPELSGDDDAGEAERKRLQDAYSDALQAMDEARFAWFWDGLANGRPMPNLLRECGREFLEGYHTETLEDEMGEEAWAAAKNKGLSLFDYAMGFTTAICSEGYRFARILAVGTAEQYRLATVSEYLDELALYQADGWDPGEASALIAKLTEIADGGDEDDE